MTSQTRKTFSPASGTNDASNDPPAGPLSDYFGLNYAQQAALLWANAAAVAAASSSNSPSPLTNSAETRCNTFPPKNNSTAFDLSRVENHCASSSNQSQRNTQLNKSGSDTANLLSSLNDRRVSDLAQSNPSSSRLQQSHTNRQTDGHYLKEMDNTANAEGALLAQFLQTLSGGSGLYQNQLKQQQQQQQLALLLAAALSQEGGLPADYLEQLASAEHGMMGNPVLPPSSASFSSGNVTNMAYAQAMMMAMAAACGNVKPPSTSGTQSIPHLPVTTGSSNYDSFPFGPLGSGQTNPMGYSIGGTEPTESFSDVLNFLNRCLNSSKSDTDKIPSTSNPHHNAESNLGLHMGSTSQRRTMRGSSSSRSRGMNGLPSSSSASPTWEPPAHSIATRHRGRGRPPKSTTISIPNSAQTKQSATSGTPATSSRLMDPDQTSKPMSEAATSNVGCRTSRTSNPLEGSIEETIDEVLRHLAACDYDPAVVATKHASSVIGMALNKKRKKDTKGHMQANESASVMSGSVGNLAEPDETMTQHGNKRSRSGPAPDSGLRLPLALGWRRETLVKGIGPGGILGEVIYVSPCGRRLWNLESVREYLKSNHVNMLSVDDFSFKSYIRLGDYYECNRSSQSPQSYVKMSDAALDALTSSAGCTDVADNPRSLQSPWSTPTHFDGQTDTIHNSCERRTPRSSRRPSSGEHPSTSIPPPVAHTHSTTLQKSTFQSNSALHDFTNSTAHQNFLFNPDMNLDSTSIPPMAHALGDCLPRTTIAPFPLLDAGIIGSEFNPFIPTNLMCGAPPIAPPNSPWSNLKQPINMPTPQPANPFNMTGLEPTMERDFVKHFFVQLADEHLRLDREKRAQRQAALREERQKLLLTYTKEHVELELKKPVEDFRLLNAKPLPKLEAIPGNRLSCQAFADCLSVLEFLHAFTEILCVDPETIPTLGMLQSGLLDRNPQCQQAILHMLIELLKFAILDPGLPSSRLVTQLIGQRFSELEVNANTVTGLLRVFLIGRNGYEDDMSDWLLPPCHFTELTGDQQAALLAFVCDELVCSSRLISTEIDRTVDLHVSLKREKWMLESKLRRLKFLSNRKFIDTNSSDLSIVDGRGFRGTLEHFDPHGMMDEATMSPSYRPDDQNESLLRRSHSTKSHNEKMAGHDSTDIHDKNEKISGTPMTTGSAVNCSFSGDEEGSDDTANIESEIDSLTQLLEYKQRAIDECAYRLSGVFLGQDRYYRRYYALRHLGGIYVEGNQNPKEAPDCSEDEESSVDLQLGFDPDHIVALIEARKQLAERRRYTITIPTGPPNSHQHQDSQELAGITRTDTFTTYQDDTDRNNSAAPNPTTGEDNAISPNTSMKSELGTDRVSFYLQSETCSDKTDGRKQNSGQANEDHTSSTTTGPGDETNPVTSGALSTECESQNDRLPNTSQASPTEIGADPSPTIVLEGGKCLSSQLNAVISEPCTENDNPVVQNADLKCDISEKNDPYEFESTSSKSGEVKIELDNGHTVDNEKVPENPDNYVSTNKLKIDSEDCNPKAEMEVRPPNEENTEEYQAISQPLDLSTRNNVDPVADLDANDTSSTLNSAGWGNGQEFFDKLGFDDVLLTTAALLFMTHTSIIPAAMACSESLADPWKSIIAHYKSILIWALMEEVSGDLHSSNDTRNVSGSVDASGSIMHSTKPLHKAMLVLKEFFLRDPTKVKEGYAGGTEATDDHVAPISEKEVEDLVNMELQSRNIQVPSDSRLEVPPSKASEWCAVTDSKKLGDLLSCLAPRGIRERNLSRSIKRSAEFLHQVLPVCAKIISDFGNSEHSKANEPRLLRVRSRRGKGRGNNTSSANQFTNRTESCVRSTDLNFEDLSAYQPMDVGDGNSSCISMDGVDISQERLGTNTDNSNTDLNPAFVLEHRLRRRMHQNRSDQVSSMMEKLEKRPGVISFKAQALQPNGRSLHEIIGTEDAVFVEECCFLEEVETLEDRVLNASLQIKGWQAPVKVLDDDTIHLIPRVIPKRSRFEHWPLDLARIRLLGLECHLERRYLLPPLNPEIHLNVVAGTDSSLLGEQGRNLAELTDHESESESGFCCGPGSESTSTSLRDGEVGHHQPVIRRVISRQTSNLENATCSTISQTLDPQTTANDSFVDTTGEPVPPGLLEWRNRLEGATELETMRICMNELISAIAWDKSIMKVLCQICRKDNNEAQLLLCDGCDHGYHTYCFRPPLVNIPQGDWFCHDCVAKATGKPICFVCGLAKLNPTSGISNSTADHGQRLLTCEGCSRALHPQCLRPLMPKIPRRWFCANCVGNHPASVKAGKSGNNHHSDGMSSCSGRSSKKIDINVDTESAHSDQAVKGFKRKSMLNASGSSDNLWPTANLHESTLLAKHRTGSKTKHMKKLDALRSDILQKIKRKSKKHTHLKEGERRRGRKALVRKIDIRRNNRRRMVGRPRRKKNSNDILHDEDKQLTMEDNGLADSRDSCSASGNGTGPADQLSPQQLDWIRRATEDLIKHEASWAFRKPVNLKQVPFYREIIKHPMDLSTIQRKVEHSRGYTSIEQWKKDVRLIFNNCEIFNEDESDVGRAGHCMRAYFEANWSNPPEELTRTGSQDVDINRHIENLKCASPQSMDSSSSSSDGNGPDLTAVTPTMSNMNPTHSVTDTTVEADHPAHSIPDNLHPSPAHSVDSDDHSSGFSGFDQNEYMLGLQLNDLHSPELIPMEAEKQPTGTCIMSPVCTSSPSETCLPSNSFSLP